MNEEDETIWAEGSSRKLLTWARIICTVPYRTGLEMKHSMSDNANRLGLHRAGEPSETTLFAADSQQDLAITPHTH